MHDMAVGQEARVEALLGRWWRDERPEWTDPSWWQAPLREDVRRLLWLPAGPLLAQGLADLPRGPACPLPHDEDPRSGLPTPGHAPGWPCACLVVTAAAWEATAAWVAAGCATALVDAAGPEPVELEVPGTPHRLHDPARDELAAALRWTPSSAATRIATARRITAHPRLVHLVRTGSISAWAARLVGEHVDGLSPDEAARLVDDVADKVGSRLASGRRAHTSADVSRLARAARLRLFPESERQSRARALAGRRVTIQQRPDGMATLIADIAESDAHRIHRRLTAIATGLKADVDCTGQPDQRTRDQVRADALVDLLLGSPAAAVDGGPDLAPWAADAAGRTAGSQAEIQVIVTLDTLLGLSQEPGQVPGLGSIPADTARTLAGDGRWTAWLADATGSITATGTCSYTPTAAVARLVRAREPHCRFPGCRRPAIRCDLDHTTPWPRGSTCPDNLGPLRLSAPPAEDPWGLGPGPRRRRRPHPARVAVDDARRLHHRRPSRASSRRMKQGTVRAA